MEAPRGNVDTPATAARAVPGKTLAVRLFGGVSLRLGELPLPPLQSARTESLLAYLLLHRAAPQSRERLAFLLWPDSTEAQARTNLRHLLHNLRRALPDADRFVEVRPRVLQWRPEADFELDVASFETAAAEADGAEGDDAVTALRRALDLYTGDLLEGVYDDWVLEHRERLRQLYLDALERIVLLLADRGDTVDAIPYAERLLRQDLLREETYRLLMRLHDERGDRARAMRVYHECAAVLERELGVEPSAATRAAYDVLLPQSDAVGAGDVHESGGHELVGRKPERAQLAELWRQAERGRAGLVLVTGEAGIGKTRLLEELLAWCEHRGAIAAVARSYAIEGALAYGPVAGWLRSGPLAARRSRLDAGRLAELTRLLPELEVAHITGAHDPLSDSERRQRLFDAVAEALLAGGGATLLVADDLQWADRETLQVIHYLLRYRADAPLLVAATARAEELDPLQPLGELVTALRATDRLVEIELAPLSEHETRLLAEGSLGRPMHDDAAGRLFTETEGNPLFVVEALRAGWAGDASESRMTPRVQAAIESRLARLSSRAADLVRVAATIGRDFTYDLLAASTGMDEDEIVGALDELWRRRIVREQGADAYDFSHDRIREVAYGSLSPARRRRSHLAVARALATLHEQDPAVVSGQLALHYDRAGAATEAVEWYAAASAEAQRMWVAADAVRLLDRALALLRALPANREHAERELELVAALLPPLLNVDGASSATLADAQRRAFDLARALDVAPPSPLLRSLAVAALAKDDFDRARTAGDELRRRGERERDELALVEGHYVLGISAFWGGELELARRNFEAAVRAYDARERATHVVRYGLDPQVICLSRLGNTLWFLGDVDAGVEARNSALALAAETGHPDTLATALVFATLLSVELHDEDELGSFAGQLSAWQRDHQSRAVDVAADAFNAYQAALEGDQGAVARLQSLADAAVKADPAPGSRACTIRLLLEACLLTGQPEAGLAAADRRLQSPSEPALWEPEFRRLRAEFLAACDAPAPEVEAELDRAEAVADRQGARSLALRISTSRVRLRLERGDVAGLTDARRRLASSLAALPHGRRTADRRDAEAVLDRL